MSFTFLPTLNGIFSTSQTREESQRTDNRRYYTWGSRGRTCTVIPRKINVASEMLVGTLDSTLSVNKINCRAFPVIL